MAKDKSRKHSYYWYCEKWDMLKCGGRATALLCEDQHYLVKAITQQMQAELKL